MSAVAAPSRPNYHTLIESMPRGSRFFVEEVPWKDYAQLVEDLMGIRRIRLSYNRGKMEIMSVSMQHDNEARFFGQLVQVLTEELGLEYTSTGSMTMTSERAEKGAEADDTFYIENLQRILGKKRVNLDYDAPPDLAIEVDVTNPSLSKLPIYAGLGIGELWRFNDGQIEFYELAGGAYQRVAHSKIFSFLTAEALVTAIQNGKANGVNSMRRSFRQWVQAHKP